MIQARPTHVDGLGRRRARPAPEPAVVEGDAARRLAPDDREGEARRVARARRESLIVGPGVARRPPGGGGRAARGDADVVAGRLARRPGRAVAVRRAGVAPGLELGVDVREPDAVGPELAEGAPARRRLIAGPSGGLRARGRRRLALRI